MQLHLSIDPRTGILLLVLSNIIAYRQNPFSIESGWIASLCFMTFFCTHRSTAVKWVLYYLVLLGLQHYILPNSPKFIATSFSILVTYARKVLPCLIIGLLMIREIPLSRFIVGLRKLHLPQQLIVAISVTIRYFPAIREESGYIHDAMKLRDIHGLKKIECLSVPLILSATSTAEELSAAAVTRGIENPVKKTSIITLKMKTFDWITCGIGLMFTIASFRSLWQGAF